MQSAMATPVPAPQPLLLGQAVIKTAGLTHTPACSSCPIINERCVDGLA